MLLTVATISIVITRNATIALIYTGLARESAHHSYVDADWNIWIVGAVVVRPVPTTTGWSSCRRSNEAGGND